jgi:polysaccharide export outer membrane protein
MKMHTRQALVLGFAIVIAGSGVGRAQSAPTEENQAGSTAQSNSTASDKPHDEKFVIGNDDVLAISVWKEPDLTKSIPVRSDGKISLPLVGEMQATGKTPIQLERDISEKLKGFITAPEVTVIVQQVLSRKFNVLGQVAKPGAYPLTAATTIVDALATAGGLRDFAKKTGIYVLRKGASGQQERLKFNYKDFLKGKNVNQNIKVEPNDTIIVP